MKNFGRHRLPAMYSGSRHPEGTRVSVREEGKPRLDLKVSRAEAFDWGYIGTAPRQLALAILSHAIPDRIAMKYYEDFCRDFVSQWADDGFVVTREEILEWFKLAWRKRHADA